MAHKAKLKTCGGTEAKTRLKHAHGHLLAAQVAAGQQPLNVSASAAITAAIAASDAICCKTLGSHATGADHKDAVAHLKKATKPGAAALTRALDLKHKAQYAPEAITAAEETTAIAAATKLIGIADHLGI